METDEEVKARFAELRRFGDSLEKESDRATLILAAAYYEDQLGILLEKFLSLDGGAELLKDIDSFSKKIRAAYGLGLISQGMSQSLHVIRSMRNKAAHKSDDLSFADARFADPINLLAGHFEAHIRGRFGAAAAVKGADPRATFINLAGLVWLGLNQSILLVAPNEAQDLGYWPAIPGWK